MLHKYTINVLWSVPHKQDVRTITTNGTQKQAIDILKSYIDENDLLNIKSFEVIDKEEIHHEFESERKSSHRAR